MKHLIIIMLLILSSCGGVKSEIDAEEDSDSWMEVAFKGHKYIKCRVYEGVSIVHSPDCECQNKLNDQ